MLNLRDKGFAHADKKYFKNPQKLESDFLVVWNDFYNIYALMSNIVKEHYGLLFNSDMSMNLTSSGSLNNLLNHTRAFQRIRTNKTLTDLGMKFHVFKSDDYNSEDIFLEEINIKRFLDRDKSE